MHEFICWVQDTLWTCDLRPDDASIVNSHEERRERKCDETTHTHTLNKGWGRNCDPSCLLFFERGRKATAMTGERNMITAADRRARRPSQITSIQQFFADGSNVSFPFTCACIFHSRILIEWRERVSREAQFIAISDDWHRHSGRQQCDHNWLELGRWNRKITRWKAAGWSTVSRHREREREREQVTRNSHLSLLYVDLFTWYLSTKKSNRGKYLVYESSRNNNTGAYSGHMLSTVRHQLFLSL